ncbi:MAG: arylesterase [Usitatibacter sp.]
MNPLRLLLPLRRTLFAAVILILCLPASAARTLLVFGDSLSAAYGLAADQGWVHLLGERARREGLDWRVVNASISGETTAGGLRRLPEDLKRHKPNVVLIALGANDALRGLPIEGIRDNLQKMIGLVRQSRAQPVLVSIMIPPNYGIDYAAGFRDLYPAIAKKNKAVLVPFLLEGLGDRREMFQPDQLHPTAAAQRIVLETVWKAIEPVLRKRAA